MQTNINMSGHGITNLGYLSGVDSTGDGVPNESIIIVGAPADRRLNRESQPTTIIGDLHVTGEITGGDGIRIADLGGQLRSDGEIEYRTDVSGNRFVSLLDQLYLDPEPVLYADLDAAVPRISRQDVLNLGIDPEDPAGPGYGQGWLPMSGLPGVQFASGVHAGGEITGVGGARIAGPRVALVAESAYAKSVLDSTIPDPTKPHGLGQDWLEFNRQGHSPDQIIAGNFADADAAYRPGAFDGDPANPLQRLKSVDHYRDQDLGSRFCERSAALCRPERSGACRCGPEWGFYLGN